MKVEVEVKVKVLDKKSLKKEIEKFAKLVSKKNSVDYYFAGLSEQSGYELMLRKSDQKKIVRLKKSSFKRSFEEKKVYQFEVDNASDFVSFLEDTTKFEVVTLKHGSFHLYNYRGVEIKLSSIKQLGDFLELSMVTKKDNITKSKTKLKDILKKLKIDKKNIVKKTYLELLTKAK